MARILVIDDENLVRTFLRDVLESAGHEVREGANGDEAIAAFGEFKPDILIVDLIMPEQDGTLRHTRGPPLDAGREGHCDLRNALSGRL